MRLSRIMFWILGGSLAITIVMSFWAGMMFGVAPGLQYVLAALWLLSGHWASAAVAMSAFERRRMRPLMVAGMTASFFGFLLWTVHIVGSSTSPAIEEWGYALATPFSALAGFAAYTGAMLHLPHPHRAVRWSRWIAVFIAAAAALHVSIAVAGYAALEFSYSEDWTYVHRHVRWSCAYGILIAYATLLTIGIFYAQRLFAGNHPVIDPVPLRTTCPRCQVEQQLMTEGDTCARCGLRIKMTLT